MNAGGKNGDSDRGDEGYKHGNVQPHSPGPQAEGQLNERPAERGSYRGSSRSGHGRH